jgi:Holliday junction resolvasome RuvABC endonuclease subunit
MGLLRGGVEDVIMRVIGVKCAKEQLQWAVLEGSSRTDATVMDFGETPAPSGDRAEQLEWVRKEVTELVTRHRPDNACLRVAEAGPNVSASLGRAEMDGVVQAALAALSIPVARYYGATVRSAFSAKNKQEVETATTAFSCVAGSAKTRRDQVIVAAASFPAE